MSLSAALASFDAQANAQTQNAAVSPKSGLREQGSLIIASLGVVSQADCRR